MAKYRLPRKWKKASVSKKGVRKRSLRDKAYNAIVKESVARTNEMFKVSTHDLSPDLIEGLFRGQTIAGVYSVEGKNFELKYVTWDEDKGTVAGVSKSKTSPCAGHAVEQEREERLNIDDILDVL